MQRIRSVRARRLVVAALAAGAAGCAADGEDGAATTTTESPVWLAGPSLPQPLANNAVAAVTIDGVTSVYTFAGIDSTKAWSGVTNVAYRMTVGGEGWEQIEPVPGPGRLAATAQVVDDLIYVFGGYTVAEDGSEKSLPDVAIYDPTTGSWSRGADIPVPTDDAVAGVWQDDRVVLVSGWHDTGNIRDVQIYHPASDSWTVGAPIVGAPVFGHTGAVVGNRVVYTGGAAVVDAIPRFQIDTTSWIGVLSGDDSGPAWREPAAKPGRPLYRAAGGTLGELALFLGGTDNPYNYTGVGYDRVPAEPIHQLLTYAPETDAWGYLEPPPEATMDHRNIGVADDHLVLVGGMVSGQRVSDRVWFTTADRLLSTARPAPGPR